MLERQKIYEMLTKENEYAQGWGGPEHDSQFHDSDWLLLPTSILVKQS